MNDVQYIFVDSDAFVAAVKTDDTNHEKAKEAFERLSNQPITLCTSNYVFSESVTVISQRVGKDTAREFINRMKSPDAVFASFWVNEDVEQKAIEVFYRQTSKNVSFTDCTNMALMEFHDIPVIFSFDEAYKKNGFSLVGEGDEQKAA